MFVSGANSGFRIKGLLTEHQCNWLYMALFHFRVGDFTILIETQNNGVNIMSKVT